MPAICGECGTTKDDKEYDFCENGHDNWIEIEDVNNPELSGWLQNMAGNLNISIEEFQRIVNQGKIKMQQIVIPKEARVGVTQFRGMVRERNILYCACRDVLEHLNSVEDELLHLKKEPQWNVDYVRNTLEQAINEEKK